MSKIFRLILLFKQSKTAITDIVLTSYSLRQMAHYYSNRVCTCLILTNITLVRIHLTLNNRIALVFNQRALITRKNWFYATQNNQ